MPVRKPPRSPGRKKGVPNVVTREAREVFKEIIQLRAPQALRWLDRVAIKNPGKAVELLVKLTEFILPKLQRTELTGANGTPLARHEAPITDAAEAARVYAQLMSGTEIDIGSVHFESPPPAALPAPAAAIEPQPMGEPPAEVAPVDPRRDASNVVDLSLWEKLAK